VSALDRAIDTRAITAGKLTAEETQAMQVLVRIREDAKSAIDSIMARHQKAALREAAEHRKTRTLAQLKIREIEAKAAIRVIEAEGAAADIDSEAGHG
jgi:hypothetical protein